MAKAQPVSSRSKISDPQEWLVAVLRTRFDEVLAQRASALGPDQLEGIHNTRVAIRRLRSVIRDFTEVSNKFPLKDIRLELKRLGNRLGAVRDADVLIEELKEYETREKDDTVRKGIILLEAERKVARQKAFEKVRQKLSDIEICSLRDRFDEALDASIRQRGLFGSRSIAEEGRLIINARLDDMMSLADALYDPASAKRLHKLRIATKHLRYAIDLFAESDPDTLSPYSSEIAKLQSSLGDLHDNDVWIWQFRDSLKRRKKPDLDEPKLLAMVSLLGIFARRRTKAYRLSLRHWLRLERDGFADQLKESLQRIK